MRPTICEGMEVVFTSGPPKTVHWRLMVKGLSTGKWNCMDESFRRTRKAAEREMRAGVWGWVFDKREWRIEPV